ncbi:hypothetical protein BsWGS_04201 [Bradybaena similaris]
MELHVLFMIVIGVACAQDQPPLRVAFENPAPRKVSAGESLTFVCHINRDIMYALQNYVEIVRRSVDNTETILTQASKRVEAEPGFYEVKITPTAENTIRLEFQIVKARDIDEGHVICRARPAEDKPNEETAQQEVQIVILRPLDTLHLKFGNFDAISASTKDPIEVESGKYQVQCIAQGSNPEPADVSLYLHGTKITATPNPEKMDADVIKYRTTITGEVELKVSNSNQEIECSAASTLGDSHSVKLPIKIKVYDPKIVCNDSEAYVGKWYPVLTCTVDYEGLNIKRFRYDLGNKDEIQEGTQNKDFVEVRREQISETSARVVLNLYQAKRWHFNTEFYLVVEHEDGHITRETVRLHEQPENVTVQVSEKGRGASRGPGGDSSGVLSVSVATLVTSVWCAYQLSL